MLTDLMAAPIVTARYRAERRPKRSPGPSGASAPRGRGQHPHHNLELYRYLPGSGIRHVVTRHEQGAGYAADGYARVSGRPGVVITTSGPGITNAITALATAYADSVPLESGRPGVRTVVRIDVEAAEPGAPWADIQRSLARALPADTVVAGDSSQVTYHGTVHSWPFMPASRLLYPTGYATLGYGLPAAIGAKVAETARPVVGLFGDGAAMFSIQELVTATEQRLAIPVVIVGNGGCAEIREQMVDRGIEPQAVDLYRPDFPALARAVGAHGVDAASAEDLGPLAAEALSADRPTVIYHRV